MRMRFRTDGWHYADLKAWGWRFASSPGEEGDKVYGYWAKTQAEYDEAKKYWDECPKAEPGDVWRIKYGGIGHENDIAGYAICCIGCGHVHCWTHARNCEFNKTRHTFINKDGKEEEYFQCGHTDRSCWDWTGSAEEGTLTGRPSLQVVKSEDEPCDWHGYIDNGDIHT